MISSSVAVGTWERNRRYSGSYEQAPLLAVYLDNSKLRIADILDRVNEAEKFLPYDPPGLAAPNLTRDWLRVCGGGGLTACRRKSESRSFENSYIPENPRTPKPLTFSKNRLRGAKNRSNISPVAKTFFRKNDFFFPKTLHMSLYNTYLKRFVKKNLKKNAKKKKKLHICTKNKKKRIVMIKNVLEGSEVGFLKGITSRSFENSYIPENPRTPKLLTFSKNRLRGAKNRSNIRPVAKTFFRKNDFFFQKLCICANFFFVHMSLYNTYLKRFVKKNLKNNAKKKKSCTYAQKIKKSCTYAKVKKNIRIVMIKNVLEGSEVGFLKGITDRFSELNYQGRLQLGSTRPVQPVEPGPGDKSGST
ncbi:hypothetical protein LXL04_010838 [Taraxacum kok-saghyz]